MPISPSSSSQIPEALHIDYIMGPDEERLIDPDTDQPLFRKPETFDLHGIAVPTIAQIKAQQQIFRVLDIRLDDQFASPLLVVSEPFRNNRTTHFKGLWPNIPVTIGRVHHTDRFAYNDYVSSNHFRLTLTQQGLKIKNLRPTNMTRLSGDFANLGDQRLREAGLRNVFTREAHDKVRDRHDFGDSDAEAPYGYYRNHPVIGRHSRTVKDGVYFTLNSEAVVVDDKSQLMRQTAQRLVSDLEWNFGKQPTIMTKQMLQIVNDYTRQKMPYDRVGTMLLSQPHFANNGLIGLSEYLAEGVGVCRHQCLLAAFLIESLQEKGFLAGRRVGVERNHDLDANGAHAWAVFEAFDGTEFVVDPAQNFVGTKATAHRQGRWKYDLVADR